MNAASTPYDPAQAGHPRRTTWCWRGGWDGCLVSAPRRVIGDPGGDGPGPKAVIILGSGPPP
jgi:hypothetical protein